MKVVAVSLQTEKYSRRFTVKSGLKEDNLVVYCRHDGRLWDAELINGEYRYDEVFAGKHQGDP